MYLRPFKELRLINFAGNPICKDPEYRSYVLSHIKNLKYLDYRLVEAGYLPIVHGYTFASSLPPPRLAALH